MAAAMSLRQQVQLCLGKAGLAVGALVYVRQGRREYSAVAYAEKVHVKQLVVSSSSQVYTPP
ncbi:MAG: hypothetical protein B7X56_03040 [Burkholderiales bacterium 34-67-9]|nr:MAG: hypothetical protein B7X56_03040 [Burkholderiales bacterium 34-67-9]